MEYANWFVVVMGVGIVFFGLIILIVAVSIMGKILGSKGSSSADNQTVAAIAAAIADDMGTDVNAIRIHSIRKIA